MARQLSFKSPPESVMANGRAAANLIRETNTMLRRNVEIVNHFASIAKDSDEKQALEEYLQDPALNSTAERIEEVKTAPKC